MAACRASGRPRRAPAVRALAVDFPALLVRADLRAVAGRRERRDLKAERRVQVAHPARVDHWAPVHPRVAVVLRVARLRVESRAARQAAHRPVISRAASPFTAAIRGMVRTPNGPSTMKPSAT